MASRSASASSALRKACSAPATPGGTREHAEPEAADRRKVGPPVGHRAVIRELRRLVSTPQLVKLGLAASVPAVAGSTASSLTNTDLPDASCPVTTRRKSIRLSQAPSTDSWQCLGHGQKPATVIESAHRDTEQPAVRRHRRLRRRRPGIHRRARTVRRQGRRRKSGVGQRRLRVPRPAMRRPRCTPACGGRASCAPSRACTRWSRASTRSAASTCPTSASSKATPAIIVIDPLISTETAAAALGAVPRAPRRPAGRRGHLHPQPRRPLRRRARRDDAGRRRRGQGRDHRARALHRTRRAGERLRRHRDGAPGRLHVRRRAGPRPAGSGGLRAGPGRIHRARWR